MSGGVQSIFFSFGSNACMCSSATYCEVAARVASISATKLALANSALRELRQLGQGSTSETTQQSAGVPLCVDRSTQTETSMAKQEKPGALESEVNELKRYEPLPKPHFM